MPRELWSPTQEQIAKSNIARFINTAGNYGFQGSGYNELFDWSVQDYPKFWEALWNFLDIKAHTAYQSVVTPGRHMTQTRWFEGAGVNFAENILRHSGDATAIIFRQENGKTRRLTFAQLRTKTAALASSLRTAGLQPGDTVGAYMPNMPETIIAMLAVTSIGGVWSSCSPDFGIQGVKDRFGQIEPKFMFTADAYTFKGKRLVYSDKVRDVAALIPSLQKVIVVPFSEHSFDPPADTDFLTWDEFTAGDGGELVFETRSFMDPVYIMYSSGTTGLPKCMVQGFGVLLNHLKEHSLHVNLTEGERIFYFTTCGWMMWNWLVSALALGATVMLYDGNPFHPDAYGLWKYAEEEKINVFGTSARYINALDDAGARPAQKHDLSSVRMLLSTGSPLNEEGFSYAHEHIGKHVQIASISGGTDLNGCFALGNPVRPVYQGQLQGRGLAMDVDIFDDAGNSLREKKGELVCKSPFPSMPLYFHNDPDGSRYKNAYFDKFDNIWRHGDFAEITAEDGLIVYGRSDATLNPGGVRIGTAELYNVIETMPEIEDSVVIGQTWQDDVRVVLFVKLAEGVQLDDAMRGDMHSLIKAKVSPRHVPAKIVAVPDIPYTINMKKVELAVKNVVEGREVTNRDALKNPECLEAFKDIPELQTD